MQCIGQIIRHLHATINRTTSTPNAPNAPIDAPNAPNDEGAEEEVNTSQLSRMLVQMLTLLAERHHDVSAYTRVVVLKAWTSLVETNVIPVTMYNTVLAIAADRMMDRTAAVRKASLQLVTCLLDNNPYGSSLSAPYFSTQVIAQQHHIASLKTNLRRVMEEGKNAADIEDEAELTDEMRDALFEGCDALLSDVEYQVAMEEQTRLELAAEFCTRIAEAVAR